MSKRLLVIGGVAGGMSAAAQARRMRDEGELEIVVFERGDYTSYAACGLPYLISGEANPDGLVARTPEQFRASGIDVRMRHEVTAVDTDARTVTVHDRSARTTSTESYDDLLIATGAVPLRPPLPGIDASGVFDLRTIPDAHAIDRALRDAGTGAGAGVGGAGVGGDGGGANVVVVGAGYIGLEAAEAFRARGATVTVLERAEQPMVTLDADMAEHVGAALDRLGVELRTGCDVEGFDTTADGSVRSVRTSQGPVDAELVVIGLGARPNVSLAQAAGIPLGESGGIVVDDHLRTSVAGVWAAGDCVESRHRISGKGVVIALGTHANKQGRAAGTNLGGGDATFEGVLGTAITRVGDVEVARTGLNEHEARDAGFEFDSTSATSSTRARYFAGNQDIAVKLVVERGTERLLGGQIVGGDGAGKRIDTIAMALWNEMTAGELAAVDLAYAPPFSPVWDPVLSTAGRAAG